MSVEFAGDFETHLTVQATAEVAALQEWAARHGLKCHHIVLARGVTPSQPMVSRRGHGVLTAEQAAAADLARQLAADGYVVTRIKIEAAPDNRDVPATDAGAADHVDRYFEHHVKLALDPAADLTALTALARRHAAHLSRNARRVRADGRTERFVTQRCYRVGRASAREQLTALLTALAGAGYPVVSVEEEFVVSDSAPGVDAGWLDEGE